LYSLALLFPCLRLWFSWLILTLHWINPRPLLILSFGLLIVKWISICYLVSKHSYTVSCLSCPVLYVNFNSLTLFGCAGRVHMFHSPFSRLCPRGRAFCMEQHTRMLSMHLCMLAPPHEEKRIIYLMKLLTNFSEARFEISLFWVLPSLLLSLFLVNMYAQNHASLFTCSC